MWQNLPWRFVSRIYLSPFWTLVTSRNRFWETQCQIYRNTITKIGKTNNTIAKNSYFSVSPCLLRGFICVYKIHLSSLFSENLRMLIKNPISYFHIGTFLLSEKNVIFWNTGKQKLSCGISLFFTGLSGTVCRGREVFFCGGVWLMKCIYRGIKNNENVRSR